MSLVEDALRKQEQEAGKQRQPFVPSTPARLPPSAAPAAAARPPFIRPTVSSPVIARPGPGMHLDIGQQRNLARMIFAGVGLLVLLAAGVFFLLPEKAKKPAGSTATATATKPSIPPAPVAAMTPPSVAASAPAPVLPRPAADSSPVAPAAPAPVVGMAPLVSNATVVAAVTPAGNAAGDPTPVVPPPPAVIWPELAPKGMFSAGGKTLVPLGDGLTLETGTTAPNGVRLLEATPALIRVAFRGQVRIYRRKGGSFIACTNEIDAGSSGLSRP
jgi:hypothetical protein